MTDTIPSPAGAQDDLARHDGGAHLGQVTMDVLSRAECLRLLPSMSTGWLAFSHPLRPRLVLVNFVLGQDQVVVRTGPGDAVTAAENGLVMSFGVSWTDAASCTGWSVTVTGTGHLVGTLLDPADVHTAPLHPWAPGMKDHVVSIAVEDVTGRRITAPAGHVHQPAHALDVAADPALGAGEACWGWWG